MKQEYNILLFGESGAGKSTTINALANYLRFQSFEAANEGDFVHKIPSKIHLFDPKTYKPLVIEDGSDDSNERNNDAGQSVTQSPKSYSFEFEDKQITIIDTPGMGDTRGIETDKQNLAKILDYLKTLNQTLHAIVFLIKTNTTRKTAAFRYCLNELLSLLSREHAQTNLVFCFTFSRNSLYGPGDGYDTLKGVLRDNQNSEGQVEIQLKNGGNCYFIDNEAYHYLVARKNGYPFTATKEKSYKESWVNSSASIKQMLNHITNLSPISPNEIFTLLEARKLLPKLEEPMEKLITEIDTRVDKIEVEKEKLQNFQNEGKLKDANALEQMIGQMLKVAEECEGELSLIKDFVIKLAFYLIEHSNSTCEKLIAPYMQLLSPDAPTQIKQFVTTTRSQFEQNHIPKIDPKEIQNFEQQLVALKHQGSYFKKIIENNQNQEDKRQAEALVLVDTKTKFSKPMPKLILNNPNKTQNPELPNKIPPVPEPTLSPTRAAPPKPPMPTTPVPVYPVPTSQVPILSAPTPPDPKSQVPIKIIPKSPVRTDLVPIPLVTPPPVVSSPVLTSTIPISPVPKIKPPEDINNNVEVRNIPFDNQEHDYVEAKLRRDAESRRTDTVAKQKSNLLNFCIPNKKHIYNDNYDYAERTDGRVNGHDASTYNIPPQQSHRQIKQQASNAPSHVSMASRQSNRSNSVNYQKRHSQGFTPSGRPKTTIEILIGMLSRMFR